MSQLAVGVPRAVAWRRRVRRARRRHRWRSLGETLSNLYMLLWLVGVYGVGLLPALREPLRTVRTLPAAAASARYWIVVAVLLAGARPALPAARAMGPPLAPPAAHTRGPGTPIDRRARAGPRLLALALAGARGRVADVGAAADALVALSRYIASSADDGLSVDVNPLLVRDRGSGVVAVDARVVRSRAAP